MAETGSNPELTEGQRALLQALAEQEGRYAVVHGQASAKRALLARGMIDSIHYMRGSTQYRITEAGMAHLLSAPRSVKERVAYARRQPSDDEHRIVSMLLSHGLSRELAETLASRLCGVGGLVWKLRNELNPSGA